MLIGYARVSTRDQTTELQTEALSAAGCKRVLEDQTSGSREDRPDLSSAPVIRWWCGSWTVWAGP